MTTHRKSRIKTYLLMSDLHGCYRELTEALRYKKPNEKVVFLGDYINRGPDSYKIIKLLMTLTKQRQAVCLKGNHEHSFTEWLRPSKPNEVYHYEPRFRQTIRSFYKDGIRKNDPLYTKRMTLFKQHTPNEQRDFLNTHFDKEIAFLKSRNHYIEREHMILAHAGIDMSVDWRKESLHCLYADESFYLGPVSEKRVFFGHTPTRLLHHAERNDVWISDAKDKVGIDGGVAYGGQLNVLRIDSTGRIMHRYAVPSFQKDIFYPLPV